MVEQMDVRDVRDEKGAAKLSTREKVSLIITIIIVIIALVVIIVLASLYGTEINCRDADLKNKKYRLASTPSMIHFPAIKDNTPGLKRAIKSKAAAETIAYSLVGGKEMTAGLFRMETGREVEFTHWYEGIMVILSGKFFITDTSGLSLDVSAGDSMYIPRGSKLTYKVRESSLMYYVIQPPDMSKFAEIKGAVAAAGKAKIIGAENFATAKTSIPLFENEYKSLSYLNDTLFTTAKGADMTAGLYKLLKGPELEYTYEYEEFKYIVDGEFHLIDGTGKFVKAKAGDLMYFPKGTYVNFASPEYALGFYVGQRGLGEA